MSKIGEWWCRLFHNELMRPVGGVYRCRACLREFPVPWEQPHARTEAPVHVGMARERLAPAAALARPHPVAVEVLLTGSKIKSIA